MGNNSRGIPISAKTLREVCSECLGNIANYKGEDDVVTFTTRFSFRKMSRVAEKSVTIPSWTYPNCGIQTRLVELQNIATCVLNDSGVKDKIIYLSEDTHTNLYYLLKKSDYFQPHIFGMGY